MTCQDDFESDRKVFQFDTPAPSALDIYDIVMKYLESLKSHGPFYDCEVTQDDNGNFTVSMPLSLWKDINRD